MATLEKDFKVKNGLVVTNGGTFGDSVSVGEPTLNGHATTKLYVDNLVSSSTMTAAGLFQFPCLGKFLRGMSAGVGFNQVVIYLRLQHINTAMFTQGAPINIQSFGGSTVQNLLGTNAAGTAGITYSERLR